MTKLESKVINRCLEILEEARKINIDIKLYGIEDEPSRIKHSEMLESQFSKITDCESWLKTICEDNDRK